MHGERIQAIELRTAGSGWVWGKGEGAWQSWTAKSEARQIDLKFKVIYQAAPRGEEKNSGRNLRAGERNGGIECLVLTG